MQASELLNLDRYPLVAEPGETHPQLVAWREALASDLYCVISNFVTEQALHAMVTEAQALQSKAHHNNAWRNCYLHRELDPALPSEHPRNLQDRSSVHMISYAQLAENSVLKQFYQAPGVRGLVERIVNEGELFPNEDPYQPANYVCYRPGDESAWHFDEDNSFTMTLMLQPAQAGGVFEMAPHTRSQDDQNYAQVRQVLTGEQVDGVVRLDLQPGDLCLFKGTHSLHRVTRVEGEQTRIMGVFVYEFRPGVVGDPRVNATIYGVPDHGVPDYGKPDR